MNFNSKIYRWKKKWEIILRGNNTRPMKKAFIENKAGHEDSDFEVLDDASMLSEEWDNIAADNILLKKSSLMHLQNVNPCSQRYYINEKEKIIFVSYRLRLNIFTLKRGLDLRLPVTIIGIPCSVSYKGYSYIKDEEFIKSDRSSGVHRVSHVNRLSKLSAGPVSGKVGILQEGIGSLNGIKLVLNADDDLSFSRGFTLPQYILDIRWSSFDEYIGNMRSHYRYRMKKALSSGADMKARILITDTEKMNEDEIQDMHADTERVMEQKISYISKLEEDTDSSFPLEMYRLYEEVYENSKDKLEKLDIEFFRTFPSTIITFYIEEGGNTLPAGFIQIKENKLKKSNTPSKMPGRNDNLNNHDRREDSTHAHCSDNELIFMFAGLNHALNLKYDIYLNMLLYMIRYAIENGYRSIDLGQTTMDTKLKLGAVSRPKYMYLTSDNPFLRPVIPLAARLLSYNEKQKTVHVFKKM